MTDEESRILHLLSVHEDAIAAIRTTAGNQLQHEVDHAGPLFEHDPGSLHFNEDQAEAVLQEYEAQL